MQGTFFIIMWVSWSGKSTILQEIIKNPHIAYVPSYTTREPRPGEEDGKPYCFITDAKFQEWVDTDQFVEYAILHQTSYYGTKRSDIQQIIDQGEYPLKEIDMQGLIIMQDAKDTPWKMIPIFLDVDDETIRERILLRNAWTSQEEIGRRITSAQTEREEAKNRCDYIIDANQPVEKVIAAVQKIIEKYIIPSS